MESMVEVCGLTDDEKIEGPTPTEVGHDNGIDWHRSEECLPWCLSILE
jgi:hypothetical protein